MVALANLPAGQSSQEFEDAWKNFPGIAHSGDGTGVGTEEMVGVEDGDKVGDGVGGKVGCGNGAGFGECLCPAA